jgi:hypothetical protein
MTDVLPYEYPKKSVSKRRAIFRKRTEKDVLLLLDRIAPKIKVAKYNSKAVRPLARLIARDIENIVASRHSGFFAGGEERELSDKELISRIAESL